MLLFWASGNFLTTGQGPVLRANEFQIGGLHCACVRKVPEFTGRWGQGRKVAQKGRKNSSLKMLATQIDRERDLCTSSEILADLQNRGVCFYHTL